MYEGCMGEKHWYITLWKVFIIGKRKGGAREEGGRRKSTEGEKE